MFDPNFGPPKRKQMRGIIVAEPGAIPDHLSPEQAEDMRRAHEQLQELGRIAHAYLHPAPPVDEDIEVSEDVADFLAPILAAGPQKPKAKPPSR
jgi:hypothetical protein